MEIVLAVVGKCVEPILHYTVEPIVGYTVAPIARQMGYVIFYKHNFKNLKDQAAELKRVKDTISHQVEAERRNGRQIRDDGKSWLNRVDEIVEAAEQLGDDPRRSNAACCKGPFPDLKSRHQLSRNAKKMAANISEVMQGKDNIYPLTFLPNLEGVGSASATSSDKLESRRKMKEDIVLALRDPNLSRIGVYGLGGVGKTTLVKEIAKQVKGSELFDEVVMVNISQAADLERIQGEIADFLGLGFEEATIAGRADRLRQRIKNVKNILVILDDIWAILDLDKLGIPPNDYKGCKLLLTSRNLDTLQKMDIQKHFLIDVLNEAEAWSLFENTVGDVVKDDCLREVAKQVAQKCAGLIVLIVTVAKALKNKDNIYSWKDALSQLNTVDEEGMTEKIYSALQFSYNHLKGNDVKELFLLCGIVGPTISVEYLLKYGMGLGIFKHAYTPKDARLKLHRLIGCLKASCLLLENNSIETVKMHDIVHDIAVSIASRDRHAFKKGTGDELKKWPSKEFLQRCTQIILKWCHIPTLPERLECPNIKFFYLNLSNENESLSVPHSFFEGMKNLKVLDLTQMHLPSLPQSFHSLIDLQTLCLDHCTLGDMTNIRALTNLQILSLKGSSMITFPSEIGQLTHLIMLDLTDSGIEIFPSNIISKLTKLEELYLGNTSIKWEQKGLNEENKNASVCELKHLTNLIALEIQTQEASVLPRDIMFDKLERYKIVVGDVWEGSDSYGASKMLKLKLDTVIHLEHWIIELIKGVEVLYLDEVNGISNVLYYLNGEGFPFLKHLHLQSNGNIQHIINPMERKPSHVFFPKLETLILQNLNTLEKICDGSFVNNSFAKLRSIKVQCCDQMKYLFSVIMVKALCQLVEIEVSECNSMKKIVSVENTSLNSEAVDDNIEFCSLQSLTLRYMPAMEDFYSSFLTSSTTTKQRLTSSTNVPSSFFNTKVKFSTLETLKLSSIHLENIWQEDHLCVASSFYKLANLTIEECNGLKYLFSSSMIGNFPNLKEVEVRECEMMEQIIGPEGTNVTSMEEIGCPILERVVISNMMRLKKVWHSQFQGLKTMEVNNCEKLENIFPSDIHTSFGRMETLKVSDCGLVKEIFQLPATEINIEEDTQLKKLHLLCLPKLKQIWSKDPQRNFRFHNLQDVHVEDCVDLEYLFPFSIAMDLPHLETLKVDSCEMNEIVGKKEGPMEEKAIFHFDRLYSLEIWNMLQLDRFYGGSHSLTCPSLRELWIRNCVKLRLMGRQNTSNHKKNADDQNPYISMQEPLFIIEEVIPNLELWSVNNEEAVMLLQDPQWKDMYLSKLKDLRLSDFAEDEVAATFLNSIVQKASNIKTLVVQCSSFKEIFRDNRVTYKEDNNKINTKLEYLRLHHLQLQHICREGCKIDPILEALEYLYLTKCANLKTLVPSSVTFPNLTYLEITKCDGLINLIYSSTATSLVNLQGITLKECKSLEEIVTQVMNEERDEIVFRSMRTLTLECLPRLNSFSSSPCFFRFPLLKKVVVRECARMKTFCEGATSTPMLKKVILKEGKDKEWCWEADLNGTIKKIYVDKISFRTLEHLELSLYHELRDSWSSLVENGIFCNLKSLVVEQCDFLSHVLIPSNLLRALGNLEEIQVRDCDSLEVLFEFDITREEAISEKAASHLRNICLFNLPKLQSIWKPSLERKGKDDAVAKVLLPKLETIILEDMKNLETIWHPIITSNSMASFKTLKVKNCHKIEHLFPKYMHEAYTTLETLQVEHCHSMQEIFHLGVDDICSGDHTAQLKNLTLLRLPKLKKIWSIDPQSNLPFKSLQIVRVQYCYDLEYLFPFSIAKNLPQLETITINNARKMKEIVSKGDEPLDNPVEFAFNQLTSMVLWNLQDLQGFYAGNHSLSCSMMNELDVFNCKKLKVFKAQGTRITSSQGRLSDGSNLQLSVQQPLFTLEEVIDKLEEFALSGEHFRIISQGHFSGEHFKKLRVLRLLEFEDDQTTFPYWFLQKMPGLEHIFVEWSSFKEIFPDEVPIHPEGKIENTTRIKKLTLNMLQELHHICKEGCLMDPILEILEYLDVDECSKLKNLVPSTVTFNHLTYLEIQNCNGLIYLITSSTARSLNKLTTLKIRKCNSIEEIVAGKEGDSINEITFNKLLVLELDNLSKLQVFCSGDYLLKLPLLVKLVIRQCPRMTGFSTGETSAPMLQKIVTNDEDGKWCWDGDLTKTVNKMFHDVVAFSTFNYLELSEYPELEELWYGPVGQKIFCNLRHLVVRKCTFSSNILFSSNLRQLLYTLEELEVAGCDSLEAIFDVKALDDKAMDSKKVSGLKKLTLSELPNLKHIWNREAEEIISFGNLQIVKVDKCQHLKYLFSVSLCHDLRQLEELHIESCGVQEIVSFKAGPEDLEFDFPRLISLVLWNLTQLTNFCPKRYTLECPSLKELNVRGCEELQIFAFDDLNPQPLADIDLQMKQALFNIEKVSQNLEELPLNKDDTMRILNGNYGKNLFNNIKRLRLQQFQETPIKFLNALIQIFPATTTLQARCSTFKTLFPSKEVGLCSIESHTQIKTLWLYQLEQLEHIWSDDESTSHPLIQNLEYLHVYKCSRLVRLAPRSASFKNLTSLEVEDCNGLTYLMTSYTAKSLVHLTSLEVRNCGMLDEVVMPDKGEPEEDIIFESLNYLELTGLSSLKNFCSGKPTFIFPSLVTLEVTGCHKMQSFSYGVIIAPFLKLVKVENGKKRWQEDLNTTIVQFFIDKAIGEEVKGDYKESSSSNIQSSQVHQMIASTSRALSSEEHESKSNADDIIDQGKQEMHKLPTPHAAIDASPSQALESDTSSIQDEGLQNQEMYEISFEKPLVQSSKLAPSTTMVFDAEESHDSNVHLGENWFRQATTSIAADYKQDVVTQETYESNKTFLVHDAQNVLDPTMVDDTVDPEIILGNNLSCKTTNYEIVENRAAIDPAPLQASSSSITPVADFCSSFKELDKFLIPHTDIHSEKVCKIVETHLDKASQNTSDLTKVDAGLILARRHQDSLGIGRPLAQVTQDASSTSTNQDTDIGTKEKHENIQRPLFQIAEDMSIFTSVQDIATGTHVTQNTWDIAIVQKKEESNDADSHLSKNLVNQTITSMAEDYKETVGSQEMCESKRRFSIHDAQNVLSPTTVYHLERNEAIDKPLIQTTHGAHSSAITQDLEESHASKAHLGKNFLNQLTSFAIDAKKPTTRTQEIDNTIQTDQDAESLATTRNTEESHDSFIETKKKSDTILKPSSPTTQNVHNSAIIPDAAIDLLPSKAPEPMTSSILESNAYSDEKWLIDISKQNLPYLEAGLKRHPHVLDWFKTKRRRAFTALFAEVTSILRTTRRCDLTEDDRNYIKECCAALEAVDFDASWLNYVHDCIERCGDGGEVKRKLEETKTRVLTLRNELASAEASLGSLQEEASRLHNFLES